MLFDALPLALDLPAVLIPQPATPQQRTRGGLLRPGSFGPRTPAAPRVDAEDEAALQEVDRLALLERVTNANLSEEDAREIQRILDEDDGN